MDTKTARKWEDARALIAGNRRVSWIGPVLDALVPVAEPTIPGAGLAVDTRWRIYFDPARLAKVTVPELAGMLYHEVRHIVDRHAARFPNEHPMIANVAGDLAINHPSREAFAQELGLELPPCLCHSGDPSPLWGGKALPAYRSAEEYRDIIRAANAPDPSGGQSGDPQSGDGQGGQQGKSGGDGQQTGKTDQGSGKPGEQPGCGSVAGGGTQPYERASNDPNARAVHPAAQGQALDDAAAAASKGRGTSCEAQSWAADHLAAPRVNWADALRLALAGLTGPCRRNTYARPSRRGQALAPLFGGRAPIIPGRTGCQPELGIVLDISGSMDAGTLSRAAAIVRQAITHVSGAGYVYLTNTSVAAKIPATVFGPSKMLRGGGTDMRAGIRAALVHRPEVVVVVTDCDTPWPAAPTPSPLIIIAVGANSYHINECPLWARVIRPEERATP